MRVASRGLLTLLDAGALGALSDEQLLGRFVALNEQASFEALVFRQ
jgi:hypothetical protein